MTQWWKFFLIFLALAGFLATLSRGACCRMGTALLRQKDCLDVGQDTALRDGHARQQLVQLLVIAYCQLKMTWHNTSLLVVTSSVAREFQNFSGKVLHNRCQVDGSAGANTLSIVTYNNQQSSCLVLRMTILQLIVNRKKIFYNSVYNVFIKNQKFIHFYIM